MSVVHTSLGALQGQQEGAAIAFRGVPYAAPPIGERRFAPPASVAPWNAIKDATKNGPIAPQGPSRLWPAMGKTDVPQDEDCLTLSIWTPSLGGEPRPVLVWLHGGAWVTGAGSLPWHDGALLAAEQNVVVVGVNYRLGPLGYLHVPGISPGNLGSMDQVAALAWVREHIADFGGDPACVTVAGQSAGAATIGRLITDPEARCLFHRAILQSGGFGRPPLSRARAAAIGAEFVQMIGGDPRQLRTIPAQKLIEAGGTLARSRARFADTTPTFMPLVEEEITAADLVTEIAANAGDLDILIGTTREEMQIFHACDPAMANPSEAAVRARFAELTGSADTLDEYRARRPGGSLLDLVSDLGTDQAFVRPTLRLAEALAEQGANVHAYQFDWAPPDSPYKACHCLDLPFTFGTLDAWPGAAMLAGGDPAQMAALSAVMRDRWGTFIRTGTPGDNWPAYDAVTRTTMIFGDLCGPVRDPAGMAWRA